MGAPWTLTLYSFLDRQGGEQEHTTADPAEARLYAALRGLVVVANTYEAVDAQPVFVPGWGEVTA